MNDDDGTIPLDEARRQRDAAKGSTDSAANTPGDVIEIVEYLAKLEEVEYEQQRKAKAKELGMRTAALDRAVKRRRQTGESGAKGRSLELTTPDPWPDRVDGAELLDGLTAGICKYLALGDGTAEAMALWTIHAHALDAAQISPRLAVTSPEKGCGKSTALSVLQCLVPKPLTTANITAAALFRTVEAAEPTLLIDEADTFLKGSDELRGILNSGHNKSLAFVIRVVGDDHEPRMFFTWAPTVIAMIGKLPDTLDDRSIAVRMRRARPDESIERFRADRTDGLKNLASKAARWAADNIITLRSADPDVPSGLFNRAADNWRAMFAIADVAGGDWPAIARKVALRLSGGDGDDGSIRTQLLTDIKTMFDASGDDRAFTSDALKWLHDMDERPWPEWRNGKPLTGRQLASLLKPFDIKSTTVRIGLDIAKGYHREAFNDAFTRYLPSQFVTAPQVKETGGYSQNPSVTPDNDVTDENSLKPAETQGCDAVTDKTPEKADTQEFLI